MIIRRLFKKLRRRSHSRHQARPKATVPSFGKSLTLILVLLLVLIPAAYTAITSIKKPRAWYSTGGTWLYRKEITIDHNQVSGTGDLTDFPVLISITDTDLASGAQADGDDILFTDINDNKLDHEIEEYNSGTGQLIAWVEIPTLDGDAATTLYMYFGDSTVSAQENESGTWNSSYLGVWHMNDDPSINSLNDSTSNNNSGTSEGSMTTTDLVSCQIGNCINFDGSNDAFSMGNSSSLNMTTNDYTVTAWIRTTENTTTGSLLGKGGNGEGTGYRVYMNPTFDRMGYIVDGTSNVVDTTPGSYTPLANDGTWQHVNITFDRGGSATVYINGVSKNSTSIATVNGQSLSNSANFYIGRTTNSVNIWDGDLDEVQVYTGLKSSDWIVTEYNNQSSPSTFYTFGSLETLDLDSPVMHLKLDEGVDNSCLDGTEDACDSSGTGHENDGDVSGAAWQQNEFCMSGKCLFFDGTDDNVTVDNSSDLDLDGTAGDAFTFSAWVKPNSDGSSDVGRIMQKGSSTYLRTTNQDASGNLDLEASLDLATSDATVTVTDGLKLNQWNQVTLTYTDDADDEITVYIDGISRGVSTNGDGSPATGDTNALLIGGTTSAYFHGFIDEVLFYNTALTDSQVLNNTTIGGIGSGVAASFGSGSTAFLNQGLAGYWKMEETSGNIADSSGNGLTLTNNNTTTFVGGKFGSGSNHVAASNQYFSSGSTLSNIYSVSFWVNSTNTTASFLQLASGVSVIVSSSTVTPSGFTNAKVFVNGIQSSTMTSSTWFHITVTSTAPITADAFQIGRVSSSNFDGIMDEVRLYQRVLSPAEASQLANWGPGPTMYWDLDSNTGTTAYDQSGNNLSGTLTNTPTWIPGKYGSAVNFAGSNQHILRADTATLDFIASQSFTIETWFKHNTASAQEAIVSKFASTGYKILMESDGDITCGIDDDATSFPEDSATSTAATYDDGTWHHIACVKNGTSSLSLYIDGVLIARDSSISSTGTLENADPFYYGINEDGTSNDFIGQLDDLRVYRYARTGGQIVEDMNGGHPLSGSPIGSQVAHWKFDEGYGTTANNSNPLNSNLSGTLVDSPTWSYGSSCKVNSCLLFSAAAEITVSNANAIDFDTNLASGFTFSAWVYPTGDLLDRYLFNKGTGTYIGFGTASGGLHPIIASVDLTSSDVSITTSALVPLNTWSHIALSYTDDSEDEITVWLNGIPIGTSTNGVGTPAAGDSSTLFLGNLSTGGSGFNGYIDEFKIYSSELTAAQIQIDMNANSAIDFGTGSAPENSAFSDGAGNPPTLHWKFDENTGTTANDSAGNALDGTLQVAPAWTPGKLGSSLTFFGNNDRVSEADNALLDFSASDSFTIQAWVKQTGGSGVRTIISKIDTTDDDGGYKLKMESDGDITCEVDNGDVGGAINDSVSSTVATYDDGNWHHVTCIKSTNTLLSLYIDGQFITSTSNPTGTMENDETFLVGITTGLTEDWVGQIDDVKVYRYVRTPAQIMYDYNRGKPVGYWPLDQIAEGSTSTITFDAASSGTTGTGSSLSFNHTVANQSNRILLVGINTEDASATDVDATSVTYNSVAMTKYVEVETTDSAPRTERTEIWYLLAPSTGTNSVSITFNGTVDGSVAGAVSLYNVAQQAPEASGTNSSNSATASTLNITTLTNNAWVFDSVAFHPGTGTTFTPGANQTERFDAAQANNNGAGSTKEVTTAGATTMTQTASGGGSSRISHAAVAIAPIVTGYTWHDTSGNSNNGTYTNGEETDLVEAKYNNGVDLDGSDEYITMGNVGIFGFANGQDFSLSGWFNRDTFTTNDVIVGKRSGYSSANAGYIVYIDASTDQLIFEVADGTSEYSLTSTSTFLTSGWNHFAVTFDESSASGTNMYINGKDDIPTRSGTIGDVGALTGSENFNIGANSTPGDYFDGKLDDIRIYNYALSAAQIRNVFNLTPIRFGPAEGLPD